VLILFRRISFWSDRRFFARPNLFPFVTLPLITTTMEALETLMDEIQDLGLTIESDDEKSDLSKGSTVSTQCALDQEAWEKGLRDIEEKISASTPAHSDEGTENVIRQLENFATVPTPEGLPSLLPPTVLFPPFGS
jgi:hypothetical protein